MKDYIVKYDGEEISEPVDVEEAKRIATEKLATLTGNQYLLLWIMHQTDSKKSIFWSQKRNGYFECE